MKKIIYLCLMAVGLIGFVIFLSTIIGFKPHDYFYIQNPDIQKYVGVNVVSAFATFSFFTYHSLILFSLWLIAYGFANLLKKDKWIKSLSKSSVVAFICFNFFITCILYTLFELTSGNPTFGFYANTPDGIYNLILNLVVHYLFSALALIVFLKIKTSDANSGKINGKKALRALILPSKYLAIYYVLVKITGMHCYKIEWYPYPIFDLSSFGALLGITDKKILTLSLLIFVLITVLFLYCLFYILLINHKRKISRNKTR